MQKFTPILAFGRAEYVQTVHLNDNFPTVMWSNATWRVVVWFGVLAVMLQIFRSTEQIDLLFTDLFFTETDCTDAALEKRCGYFGWHLSSVLVALRWVGHEIPLYLMALVCLHMTWLMMFNPNKTLADIYPPLVAIITGLLGPLFIVNLVLKEYWGRPRPNQTLFFGGDNPYVRPGDISNYCESNCSFVSGEAAAAFWMLALMFYFTGLNRKRFLIGATILATAISFLRVTFGRHYISDVVTAGLISVLLIALAVCLLQTKTIRRWLAAMLKFSNTYAFGRHKLRN